MYFVHDKQGKHNQNSLQINTGKKSNKKKFDRKNQKSTNVKLYSKKII